jgi:hypothetical protein
MQRMASNYNPFEVNPQYPYWQQNYPPRYYQHPYPQHFQPNAAQQAPPFIVLEDSFSPSQPSTPRSGQFSYGTSTNASSTNLSTQSPNSTPPLSHTASSSSLSQLSQSSGIEKTAQGRSTQEKSLLALIQGKTALNYVPGAKEHAVVSNPPLTPNPLLDLLRANTKAFQEKQLPQTPNDETAISPIQAKLEALSVENTKKPLFNTDAFPTLGAAKPTVTDSSNLAPKKPAKPSKSRKSKFQTLDLSVHPSYSPRIQAALDRARIEKPHDDITNGLIGNNNPSPGAVAAAKQFDEHCLENGLQLTEHGLVRLMQDGTGDESLKSLKLALSDNTDKKQCVIGYHREQGSIVIRTPRKAGSKGGNLLLLAYNPTIRTKAAPRGQIRTIHPRIPTWEKGFQATSSFIELGTSFSDVLRKEGVDFLNGDLQTISNKLADLALRRL